MWWSGYIASRRVAWALPGALVAFCAEVCKKCSPSIRCALEWDATDIAAGVVAEGSTARIVKQSRNAEYWVESKAQKSDQGPLPRKNGYDHEDRTQAPDVDSRPNASSLTLPAPNRRLSEP